MSDYLATSYISALDAMRLRGPKPLFRVVEALGDPSIATGEALRAYLESSGPDDSLRKALAHALAGWDHVPASDHPWTAGTEPNTTDRRQVVLTALDLDEDTRALIDRMFPIFLRDGTVVIADEWEPWRTPERRAERDFYWCHYELYLRSKNWHADAIAELADAADEVVGRLSDPTRPMAYQAKGLVVGYVQSGKTANFTGVIAKAIDAGYRLIIVLTGTTNMLRAQTQRRLDMELTGRENLEREISAYDTKGHDYEDDPDWIADKFVRHGGQPSDSGYPDIHRLTTHRWDYKKLRQGIAALDFERRDRSRPFYDPVNLFTSNARLVVAKKNAKVLSDLVADLGRINERLADVPVLIIDDESDQASINTSNPAKWKDGRKERKKINKLISQLLTMMPRAQYVGYTATPYANLFIDPSDVEDLFPSNFIVALGRPRGYMGADDFHDFGPLEPGDERDPAKSNVAAHVRFLSDEPNEEELREAIDMFVLTGAVKLYRQRHGAATYRHHTMLVHEAMHKVHHDVARQLIEDLWNRGGYHVASGMARLRDLYLKDLLPVSRARAADLPTPENFDDLLPDISEAVSRIAPPNGKPVIVVNSDKELERERESLDFDKREIWRILVGGNSLARGFTVESLTVTYYRRSTNQADTLMQMGRWFGFRPKYRDLVRLYTTRDLHSMFEAACLDEQFLRNELRRYAPLRAAGDRSMITPQAVPPLVAQHLDELRPAARNKMWNARLVEKAAPGEPMEPVNHPTDPRLIEANTTLWKPILAAATDTYHFRAGARATYEARVAVVGHRDMLAVLGGLTWLTEVTFEPELAWLRGLAPDQLDRWVVIIPQQANPAKSRTLFGHGPFSIFERQRKKNGARLGAFGVFSEQRHRNPAYRIAGVEPSQPDPEADRLAGPATASIIVYPTVEPGQLDGTAGDAIDPSRVTMGFHIITPFSTRPRGRDLIMWVTRDSRNPRAIAVPFVPPPDAQPYSTRTTTR
jgi:Z1 domain.